MLDINLKPEKWQKLKNLHAEHTKNGATSNYLGYRPVMYQGISAHGVLRNKNFKLPLNFLNKFFPCPVDYLFFHFLGSFYHRLLPFHKPFQHLLQSPNRWNLQSLYARHYPMEMCHLAIDSLGVVESNAKQTIVTAYKIFG